MTPANKNLALNSIISAAFGAAGQRCMAISVGKPSADPIRKSQPDDFVLD